MFSQIGINTITPDTSAALHIVSKPYGQGLLIPRLTQAQRVHITKPAKALMVYDVTDNLFYMNLDSAAHNWYVINPWQTKATTSSVSAMYTHSTVTNVGIGTNNPTARLDVNGDIKSNTQISAPTVTANVVATPSLIVPSFATNALVPTGAIVMWSGTVTSIPTGWALCDGTNGTPDLRGRFIVGYDGSSNTTPTILTGTATANVTNYGSVGNKGGENAHVLDITEMPTHKHDVSASNRDDSFNFGGPGNVKIGDGTDYTGDPYRLGISISETLKGNDQPHENRPPYYVLAFIIKLP